MNFRIKIKKLRIIQTPYLTTSEDFGFCKYVLKQKNQKNFVVFKKTKCFTQSFEISDKI